MSQLGDWAVNCETRAAGFQASHLPARSTMLSEPVSLVPLEWRPSSDSLSTQWLRELFSFIAVPWEDLQYKGRQSLEEQRVHCFEKLRIVLAW